MSWQLEQRDYAIKRGEEAELGDTGCSVKASVGDDETAA